VLNGLETGTFTECQKRGVAALSVDRANSYQLRCAIVEYLRAAENAGYTQGQTGSSNSHRAELEKLLPIDPGAAHEQL
jgi:hypothetical protein